MKTLRGCAYCEGNNLKRKRKKTKMKKLMIAAAIVCAAAMSQAATANWQASSFGTYDNSASEMIAFNWAIIDLGTSTVDASKLSYDGTTVKLDGVAQTAIQSDVGDGWGLVASGDDYTIGHYYTMLIYDQTNKKYGIGAQVLGVKDETPGATGLLPLVFDNASNINIDDYEEDYSNGIVANLSGATPTPEPTSGLLLLLGVAGLALRRKQK